MGFSNVDELFDRLNEGVRYVVLRNYEDLDKEIENTEHPDIDFLCESAEKFMKRIPTESRGEANDRVHRKVLVGNKEVYIDIREVGDGYYDSRWESDMIDKRIIYRNRIFVPNDENYYYSLLYHALIQKKEIAPDYHMKLKEIGEKIGVMYEMNTALELLEKHMRHNGYKYSYPQSPMTVFNIKEVSKDLIEKNWKKSLKRALFRLIRF